MFSSFQLKENSYHVLRLSTKIKSHHMGFLIFSNKLDFQLLHSPLGCLETHRSFLQL